jgi:DNA-binding HxlR family transcriptional regulator
MAVAKYNQYCPVARASEIFADRWTPLIIRELVLGSRHFNEIERGLPGISRSLLVSRLRHLEDSGVIERHQGNRSNVTEYLLTEAGNGLKAVIEQLGAWGVKWAFGEPRAAELDPALLLWKIHQRIHRHELPPGRTVVQFDVTGRKCRRLWLVLTPQEISVCLKPPGFDSDLLVRSDVLSLYRVWFGHIDYHSAVARGEIVVEGPPHLVRALPRWFMWSPMARFVRALHAPPGALETSGAAQEALPH